MTSQFVFLSDKCSASVYTSLLNVLFRASKVMQIVNPKRLCVCVRSCDTDGRVTDRIR